MATAVTTVTSRLCACNCGERFTPPITRPGQAYMMGHRPGARRTWSRSRMAPISSDPLEAPRKRLDYQLTRSTAAAEALQLEREIDACDNAIQDARDQIADLQARKDGKVQRHLALETMIALLDHILDGKPLPAPSEG